MKFLKSAWEDEELERDQSIYCEEERSALLEDDAISPAEAAFMQGWDEAME